MNRQNNQSGFGIIEIIIVVAVVAALGFGGWAVYRHARKTTTTNTHATTSSTTTTTTTPTVTSDELIAVAKQVYYQVAAAGSNPAGVGTCGAQNVNSCPFTADLITKIDNPPGVGPGDGPTLIAGIQNGPFGTIAYSDATPTAQGGTVTATVTPDASLGGGIITWKMTTVESGGKLLVSDIQYSQTAHSGRPACGPIEIYDYISCPR